MPFLFDSVLFMSSLVGGVGVGYLSHQCSISPCDVSWLAAARQFWNILPARENLSEWEVLEDTHLRREESEQGCQWGKESLGRSAGQRLKYISWQMNGGRLWDCRR